MKQRTRQRGQYLAFGLIGSWDTDTTVYGQTSAVNPKPSRALFARFPVAPYVSGDPAWCAWATHVFGWKDQRRLRIELLVVWCCEIAMGKSCWPCVSSTACLGEVDVTLGDGLGGSKQAKGHPAAAGGSGGALGVSELRGSRPGYPAPSPGFVCVLRKLQGLSGGPRVLQSISGWVWWTHRSTSCPVKPRGCVCFGLHQRREQSQTLTMKLRNDEGCTATER